jgi:hypothetical protein
MYACGSGLAHWAPPIEGRMLVFQDEFEEPIMGSKKSITPSNDIEGERLRI